MENDLDENVPYGEPFLFDVIQRWLNREYTSSDELKKKRFCLKRFYFKR